VVIFLYRFKKIEHDVMQYIPSLVEKFSVDRDIVSIYLFGSCAEGKQTIVGGEDCSLAVINGLHKHSGINYRFLCCIQDDAFQNGAPLLHYHSDTPPGFLLLSLLDFGNAQTG
jgi:hypothetical protein